MCGLCGEIRFDHRQPDLGAVRAMADAMEPRGPDAGGVWSQGPVALGHRRLKIIDLSDASQQPMIDAQLGLAGVYNGAIYNFRELRAELEAKGYRFFSQGDTEVLLKAYHAWGPDFVQRLNGMFAVVIVSRETGEVFVARDRLGIKPLYYAEVDGGLRFASSLPALVAGGGISRDLDPVALHHYMSFHAVVPAPHTMLQQVRKLPPAHSMLIHPDGRRDMQEYWRPYFGTPEADRNLGFDDWKDRVHASLRQAVDRRLVADVPVGVLLSGGLDSSLIVGLLDEAGQTGLQTFSVGFESVGDMEGDEFKYSKIIADRFQTEHHKLFVESDRMLRELPNAVAAMSEPMVSHDVVGFYLLSQAVSQHVKVVQSGQGADEVFAGYHWYPPMLESTDPVGDYARVFFDRDQAGMARALNPQWLGDDHSRAFVEAHFARTGATRPIDQTLRIDTQIMLVDDPVKRVDNMTMAWGLEARVPFLDHELVELAAQVPAEHKVPGKHILKEIAREVIPHEVIDRPKGYFPVPALKYIRGPVKDMVQDILSQPAARERALFRQDYLDTLFKSPEDHITPLGGSELWQCALLEFWLQSHNL